MKQHRTFFSVPLFRRTGNPYFTGVLLVGIIFVTVLFFSVPNIFADLSLDEDGLLTIGNGESATNVILDSAALTELTSDSDLMSILIEKEGTLEIEENTMVHLGGGTLTVKGTLSMSSTLGTGIYSSEEPWDGDDPETFTPDKTTALSLDGGILEIRQGEQNSLKADTVNLNIQAGGGTVNIAKDITYKSGSVSGSSTAGNLTKVGDGTLQIGGKVGIAGSILAEEGTIDFLQETGIGSDMNISNGSTVNFRGGETTVAGTLNIGSVETAGTATFLRESSMTVMNMNIETGSILQGLPNEEDKPSGTLLVAQGGTVKGTLTGIGYLLLGDGTRTADLSLEGGNHNVEKIGISQKGTLDIKSNTLLGLTSTLKEGEKNEGDIAIVGTLKINTDGTAITKKNDEDILIKLAGVLEIYQDETTSSTDSLFVLPSSSEIRVIEAGEIKAATGTVLEGGKITWESTKEDSDYFRGLVVQGGGTLQAESIDLGEGWLGIKGEGTTVEITETDHAALNAAVLTTEEGTTLIARSDAAFGNLDLAGNYEGNGKNLSVEKESWIIGHVAGVNTFTQGGDLMVKIEEGETAISVQSWNFADSEKPQRIRVVESEPGNYEKAIEISGGNTSGLLDALQTSETALYKPLWTENTEDSTFLDLNLKVLSVQDYVTGEWKKNARNAQNAGWLIDQVSNEVPNFRSHLEGLNDTQLQDSLRTVLAGELAGDAMRFALFNPSSSIFRHLDDRIFGREMQGHGMRVHAPAQHREKEKEETPKEDWDAEWEELLNDVRGQVQEGFNVWFTPYGQAEKAKRGGNTTLGGYNLSRYGFLLGSDVEIYDRAVAGAYFGYAHPYMRNRLGHISANDYSAGLYLRTPVPGSMIARVVAGFGSQNYQYQNGADKAGFRGSSLFASAEVSKSFAFQRGWLSPFAAWDIHSVSMNRFIVANPSIGGVAVKPENLSQLLFRLGLAGNFGRFHARTQYMRRFAGDEAVSSRTSLIVGNFSHSTSIRSTQWGRDWLSVNFGGELLTFRNWRFFADYDFEVSRRTASHFGSLSTVLKW